MEVKLCDLQRKEVVSVRNGVKLGFADDVTIDTEAVSYTHLAFHYKVRNGCVLGCLRVEKGGFLGDIFQDGVDDG